MGRGVGSWGRGGCVGDGVVVRVGLWQGGEGLIVLVGLQGGLQV